MTEYPKTQPKWVSVDELITEIEAKGVSSLPFSCNSYEVEMENGLVYSVEKGVPLLRVTEREVNPLIHHYDDFVKACTNITFILFPLLTLIGLKWIQVRLKLI